MIVPDYSDVIANLQEWKMAIDKHGDRLGLSAKEKAAKVSMLSRDIASMKGVTKRNSDKPRRHSSSRVLIVEDNPDLLDELIQVLNSSGYHCVGAATGDEAVEAAIALHPEVLLIDYALPGDSGFVVMNRIAALPEAEHAVIIMMSGFSTVDLVVQALRRQVFDFLVKPIDPQKLISAVDNASNASETRGAVINQRADIVQDLAKIDAAMRAIEDDISKLLHKT